MTLNNYQFQFGSFQFGGAGSPFQIISVDGLESLPQMRVQDDNRGFNDGAFSGRDFYSGRTITFTVHVFAGNGNSAHQNFNLFQQYLQPQQSGTQTLQFLLSQTDTEKQLNARVRSRTVHIDPEYTFGYIRCQVSMFAPDPRYYDNLVQVARITPSGVINGRTYNRVYDLSYGGGSLTNTVTIINAGWIYTSPIITINGPITNPAVSYVEGGQTITVNFTLGAFDQLVLDMTQNVATLNGSPVRNLVSAGSQWFTIPANSTATISLNGTAVTAGTTSATVNWKNAYI